MSVIGMLRQRASTMPITATRAACGVIYSPVRAWRCSMKRRWVIVAITSMALIGAGVLVRTERNNRRLTKLAVTYGIRARQGDAKAQLTLGWMYYYGKGLPKDYVEAALWYRKSAEQGDAKAQYSL